MLEHLGKVEEAIDALWGLRAGDFDPMFHEGLTDAAEHMFRFFPYEKSEPVASWGGRYGMKVALQDHWPETVARTQFRCMDIHEWFARAPMECLLRALPGAHDVVVRAIPGHEFVRLGTVRRADGTSN